MRRAAPLVLVRIAPHAPVIVALVGCGSAGKSAGSEAVATLRRYAEAVEAGNAAQACSLVGEAALLRLRRRGLGCEDEIASLRAGVDANGLLSRPHGGETRAELQVQLDQGRSQSRGYRQEGARRPSHPERRPTCAVRIPGAGGSAVAKALIDNGEAAVTFLSPSQARFRASPGSG